MPIFEYRCGSCGAVTEVLELPGGHRGSACKQCGNEDTEKIFSTFGVQMAGTSPCDSGDCSPDSCDMAACPSGGCPMAQ